MQFDANWCAFAANNQRWRSPPRAFVTNVRMDGPSGWCDVRMMQHRAFKTVDLSFPRCFVVCCFARVWWGSHLYCKRRINQSWTNLYKFRWEYSSAYSSTYSGRHQLHVDVPPNPMDDDDDDDDAHDDCRPTLLTTATPNLVQSYHAVEHFDRITANSASEYKLTYMSNNRWLD